MGKVTQLRQQADEVEIAKVVRVRVEQVRPFAGQPRIEFDPERIKELASSIREFGQQVAIIVRELPDGGDHRWEVVDGERRLRAHQLLGLKTIRAEVRGAKDDDHQFMQSVVANFGRAEHTPIEAAMAVMRVWDMPEYAALSTMDRRERVAALFARSPEWIDQQRRLMTLPKRVLDLLSAPRGERLNPQVALALCAVRDPDEQVRIAELVHSEKLSASRARVLIRKAIEQVGIDPSRRGRRPSDESAVLFRQVHKITEAAELVLEMPMSAMRKAFTAKAAARSGALERVDAAIARLTELRTALQRVR